MKVSVIIPCYNSAQYLAGTIHSALNQSWKEIEIIVVDDGSTDNSVAIARSFESSKVKVIAQVNAGACTARNHALSLAQGDYIQFLDADDILAPDKIERQIRTIEPLGSNAIASCSWVKFYNEADISGLSITPRPVDKNWDHPIDWLIHSWEGGGTGQTAVWLASRDLVEMAGPWNENLLINQDGEYFCRLILLADQIKYVTDTCVYYRMENSNSISRSVNKKKIESQLQSLMLCEQHLLKKEDSPRTRHALMKNYLFFMYHWYDTYPEIIEKAKKAVYSLGYLKLEPVGGKNFKIFAQLLGYERALRFRSSVKKLF